MIIRLALARLLSLPRWIMAVAGLVALLGSGAAAYRLGGSHQFAAGFEAGRASAIAEARAAHAEGTLQYERDDLQAERRVRAADPAGDPAALERLCAKDPACPDR